MTRFCCRICIVFWWYLGIGKLGRATVHELYIRLAGDDTDSYHVRAVYDIGGKDSLTLTGLTVISILAGTKELVFLIAAKNIRTST